MKNSQRASGHQVSCFLPNTLLCATCAKRQLWTTTSPECPDAVLEFKCENNLEVMCVSVSVSVCLDWG